MYIPITRYGLPQVLVYPAAVLALMAALFFLLPGGIALILTEIMLFLVFIWMLMFFRNPRRNIVFDERTLLAPADGTVTDISEVEHPDLGGKALRIGIFLSIFNVHLNRMPCSVRVEAVRYKKGQFKNAMSGESGTVNEANEVLMTRLAVPSGEAPSGEAPSVEGGPSVDGGAGNRLLVRQVSGAVARRIVCEARPGMEYAQGGAFGMIKFGSRTELYLPVPAGRYDITVKTGDKVRAGLSPLIIYKP